MKIENASVKSLITRIINYGYSDNNWADNKEVLELRKRILLAPDQNTQAEIIAEIINEAGLKGIDPNNFS